LDNVEHETEEKTMAQHIQHGVNSSTLADVLERVLDKGVVVAGDIRVRIADIELICIQIRLVVCSVDKAREMGMDWWVNNPIYGRQDSALGGKKADAEMALPEATASLMRLEGVLERLEQRLDRLEESRVSEPGR